MKTKAITCRRAVLLTIMALMSVGFVVTPISAQGTGFTVIVSGEDVWFGASSVSGQWRGGGSVCATSMAQPKPPPLPGAMVLARVTVTGGGPGTFAYPAFTDTATGEPVPAGTNTFAVYGLVTVMYSIDPAFPVGAVVPSRVTFDYTEGHSDQNVVILVEVALGVYVPIRYIHDAHVVINTVG